MFNPPQSGVEHAKRGGFPPRLKVGGVEHSTPVLHPSLGWSKSGKRGGALFSEFRCAPPQSGVEHGVDGMCHFCATGENFVDILGLRIWVALDGVDFFFAPQPAGAKI